MRKRLLVVIVAVLVAAPAYAQSAATEHRVDTCRRFDSPPSVVVTKVDGMRLRGTLLCLGDEVELATEGRVSRTPLKDVKRIAEPRDPVWNGAAVGAALGGLIWLLCEGACETGYMARTTLYYGLTGLILDSAISSNKTIYQATVRSPALAFRFRF